MSDHSEVPLSNRLKTAVFVLIILTIFLLTGAFFFFVSVSVLFHSDGENVTSITSPQTSSETNVFPTYPHATAIPSPTITVDMPTLSLSYEIETAVPLLPTTTQPAEQTRQNPHEFGVLIIPEIGVNQNIIPIFVRDGQWDISDIGGQIGHLETTGRYPGDRLAMTFTGHVTLPWPEIEGPFADLLFLERGEEITYRWDGVDYIYQVERIFRVNPNSVNLLYEEDGDKLILVTCSGWDVNGREYGERLVTRATLVRKELVSQNSE